MPKLFNNKKAVILWSVVTLFFAFQFILRLSIGILREEIIQRYQIDNFMFGSLAGCYYLGYALMQLPFGILLDKFNFRFVTIAAIIITIIGTLPFVFSQNWQLILLGRFLIGAGSAVSFLAVTKVIKLYFSDALQGKMIGFSFTFGLLGAVFGGRPMKFIFDYTSYEQGFIILMIFSAVIACMIFFAREDKFLANSIDQTTASYSDILQLISNPNIIIIGISGGLMVGALEGFADVWSIPFFNKIYNFDLNDSIIIASFVYIGMCFGGPILAYFVEYFNSANKVITVINLLTVGIFILLFNLLNWNFYILCALMILLGILCCYQVIIFAQINYIIDKRLTGLAIAVTNCLNMSFGYLFHIAISWMMKFIEHQTEDYYMIYVGGLAIVPIACLLGGFGFVYISRK